MKKLIWSFARFNICLHLVATVVLGRTIPHSRTLIRRKYRPTEKGKRQCSNRNWYDEESYLCIIQPFFYEVLHFILLEYKILIHHQREVYKSCHLFEDISKFFILKMLVIHRYLILCLRVFYLQIKKHKMHVFKRFYQWDSLFLFPYVFLWDFCCFSYFRYLI